MNIININYIMFTKYVQNMSTTQMVTVQWITGVPRNTYGNSKTLTGGHVTPTMDKVLDLSNFPVLISCGLNQA